MDDDLVCSDLCEEHGFLRPAELLRALAAGGRTAYLIMERGAEYNDEIMSPNLSGEPRTVYLDKAEAEREAALRNARWYRDNNVLDYCYRLRDVTPHAPDELSQRISLILGRRYELPDGGEPTFAHSDGPLVKGPVTDEQMLQIAGLFTLKFFYVTETQFARPEGVLPLGDGDGPPTSSDPEGEGRS